MLFIDRIALQIFTVVQNYLKVETLLVKDLEIPVFVEKEFNVQRCIRGYQIYQTQWNAQIGCSKVLNKTDILLFKKWWQTTQCSD